MASDVPHEENTVPLTEVYQLALVRIFMSPKHQLHCVGRIGCSHRIESTKTTSMEDFSTGVLEKI